jgi:hypothetical protein
MVLYVLLEFSINIGALPVLFQLKIRNFLRFFYIGDKIRRADEFDALRACAEMGVW